MIGSFITKITCQLKVNLELFQSQNIPDSTLQKIWLCYGRGKNIIIKLFHYSYYCEHKINILDLQSVKEYILYKTET